MILRIILFVSFFSTICDVKANDIVQYNHKDFQLTIESQTQFDKIENDSITTTVKFKRGKAILFTILTGLFGGHRIYFGTHQRTPIIYSVTLGGLGLLPLLDLINIIFTKDLSNFENKSQIIMWGK